MMKISRTRLAAFVEILTAMVPECRLIVGENGWNTQATDTANVGMVIVSLPKASFEEYIETGRTEIGMNVLKWVEMLKVMDDDKSTIAISHTPGKSTLTITDGKYTYTHNPLDPTTVRKWPNTPGIQLPAKIVIAPGEFAEAIKAMSVIGDKVIFTAGREGLALETEGDTDHLRKPLTIQDTGASTLPEIPMKSLFSLDYMRDIAKAMKGAGSITVCMGQDHPIRFDFEIDGLLEASFLQAPRIEAEGP